MHFSQLHTDLHSCVDPNHGDGEVLRVRVQGFMDIGALEGQIAELSRHITQHTPTGILCDLRTVAGYSPGTSSLARDWLMLARRAGIQRVALVATSSVLRTAALMLARELDLQLRCFLGETEALRWLTTKN